LTQPILDRLRAGQLSGARRLTLGGGLTAFPRDIFALADTLEVLDLSGNALTSLPDDLPRLHKLRILFCSGNRFDTLPEVLGECAQLDLIGFKANAIQTVPGRALPPRLRWLILTDNRIDTLPPELGRCTRLQKLMLAGNRLRTLPDEMAACTRLELVRLAANRLAGLPSWLLALPRLAWLAFGGNPFAQVLEDGALGTAPIRRLPWTSLAIGPLLGEGASGVIHRAELRDSSDGSTRDAAVKLFKGAVTSDGLPHSEMVACLAAGAHPNLIPVLGKVDDHPAARDALVMSLIDPRFGNLAGPPSLDSCTRDVYADGVRLTAASAVRISAGIASAACHLHRRGILHGDLYAHNILYRDDGQALLGDFGAASFYARAGSRDAHALERIEVRAFGCLLEELLACIEPQSGQPSAPNPLAALKDACLATDVAARPGFEAIDACLSGQLE
jgi:hypothetical protein